MSYDYRAKLKKNDLHRFPKKEGCGVLNTIIDNFPFEVHFPGNEYGGFNPNLDLKLLQGVKPANKLDEAAMNHDIAYARDADLDKRHQADYKLQEDAWKRVIADDSSFGEKVAAYLTTNAMKAKRWLGAGVKYPINLDEKDQKLILEGIQLKTPITLNLKPEQLIRTKNSVMSETYLPLSKNQIKDIKKGKKQNKAVDLKLGISQLEYINANNKTGGFLPGLLTALPVIAGVATNIFNAYNNKKANDKLVKDRIEKGNTDAENLGYGLKDEKIVEFINHHKNAQLAEKKLGKGFYVGKKKGQGFYIDSKKKKKE